jgi:transposase InsO family protein
MAMDYRNLNEVCIKDSYQMPKIQDLTDALEGAVWFSCLDCCSAFHQIPLADERSKDLTSFTVPGGGLWRFTVMPFGFCNSPAVWSRFIDGLLTQYEFACALVYMDDILVYTKGTAEEHIAKLDAIFDVLDAHGIKLKASKMKLGLRELQYLGVLVGENGIRPDPAKTKAVDKLPFPTTIHELRQVCGSFSYYRRFVKNVAEIEGPLRAMRGKNVNNKKDKHKHLAPTPEAVNAFAKLKQAICSDTVLSYPDWTLPFHVQCDASDKGLGTILCQVGAENQERVIMYASRSLTDVEKRYCTYEKECLSLVWSFKIFHQYLYGRKSIVTTDCQALKWLLNAPESRRIAPWVMQLQQYSFDIVHKPGKFHTNADGLSRSPLESTQPYGEDPIDELYEATATKEQILTNVADAIAGCASLATAKTVSNTLFTKVVLAVAAHAEGKPSAPMVVEHEVFSVDAEVLKKLQDETGETEADFERLTRHRDAEKCNGLWCIRKDDHLRAIVPNKAKAAVMAQNHNLPLAGHNGVRRTIRTICQNYYWRGMTKDIKRWIGACSLCTKRKTPRPIHAGMRDIVLATRANQTWAIDIVGPLPETDEGHKWMLTCVDAFTRWPIVTPLRDRSEKSIVNALYITVTERGRPETILSDQGKELIGKAVKSLCKQWQIRKIQTGGYNPTGNSSVERFHRYLLASLTILSDQTTPDWTEFLPATLFAYRVSVNDSTGSSPYVMEHGRDANLPQGLDINVKEFANISEHADAVASKLREAWTVARTMQHNAAVANKQRRPEGLPVSLKKGDEVYLWAYSSKNKRLFRTRPSAAETDEDKARRLALETVRLPTKLSNRWKGPFVVTHRVSELYCIIDEDGVEKNYHVNRLTKHHSWDSLNSDTSDWLQKGGVLPSQKEKITLRIQPDGVHNSEVRTGDFIVFPMQMSDNNPWPVGIGKVTNAENKDDIAFHYWGNTKANFNGVLHPCWLDSSDSKIYYRDSKMHNRHTAVTSNNYTDIVGTNDLICVMPTLLNNGRLREEAKQAIALDPRVVETWKKTMLM